MKPQYKITDEILESIRSISHNIGEINSKYLYDNSNSSKKEYKKKLLFYYLQKESNSITEDQLSALLENENADIDLDKLDIQEALNYIKLYKNIDTLKYHNENDFLQTHSILMKNIIKKPGKYRNREVIIIDDNKLEYLAPDFELLPGIMKDLFKLLKDKTELSLIKSCVFHYEMENIYPFMKGNGKLRRFWQNLILVKEYPIFEILSLDDLILKDKEMYYKTMYLSRESGKLTKFIEYILNKIDVEFLNMLKVPNTELNKEERINKFLKNSEQEFTRKNYLSYFSNLSPATASRDLKYAVDNSIIIKKGDRMTTIYYKK